MTEYRMYILNHDGKITEAVDFTSADDAAARRHTRDMAAGNDAELWQGTRIVAKVEAATP